MNLKKKGSNLKMDFTKYLVENAYVLIPVLYIIGNILKDLKFISDKYIPVILLAFGILLAWGWLGFNMSAVIQGILLTGIAVYSNQVVKQLVKNNNSIADITVQAIKAAETKEEVQAEASTTAINNTVSENSVQVNNSASAKIVVDNPENVIEDGQEVKPVTATSPTV